MIRGSTRQTASIKCDLLVESEVLASYAEPALVSVLSVRFVIHPEAPHLGASPDGRLYKTTDDAPFGLAEVKSTIKKFCFPGGTHQGPG